MQTGLPHEAVYVRLGPSGIHGIGVFAIRPIPAGTILFADDAVPLVWVNKAELEQAGLSSAQRRLYRDFGINREGMVGCPASFNNLGPSWYLNEPPSGGSANVRSDAQFNFTAARHIAKGEELTIDYSDFSEPAGA